jgi:hypothetical protein
MDERDEQWEKAKLGIRESLESIANATFNSLAQREKQPGPSDSTGEGRQIETSEEQLSNAELSILDRCESAAKITVASERHFENTPDSTTESSEPVSNATLERHEQPLKH